MRYNSQQNNNYLQANLASLWSRCSTSSIVKMILQASMLTFNWIEVKEYLSDNNSGIQQHNDTQ